MDDDNKTPHIDLPDIYGIDMCKPSKLGGWTALGLPHQLRHIVLSHSGDQMVGVVIEFLQPLGLCNTKDIFSTQSSIARTWVWVKIEYP